MKLVKQMFGASNLSLTKDLDWSQCENVSHRKQFKITEIFISIPFETVWRHHRNQDLRTCKGCASKLLSRFRWHLRATAKKRVVFASTAQ